MGIKDDIENLQSRVQSLLDSLPPTSDVSDAVRTQGSRLIQDVQEVLDAVPDTVRQRVVNLDVTIRGFVTDASDVLSRDEWEVMLKALIGVLAQLVKEVVGDHFK